ncbi:IS1 family transposase [Endozoicomonas euniceicola]
MTGSHTAQNCQKIIILSVKSSHKALRETALTLRTRIKRLTRRIIYFSRLVELHGKVV